MTNVASNQQLEPCPWCRALPEPTGLASSQRYRVEHSETCYLFNRLANMRSHGRAHFIGDREVDIWNSRVSDGGVVATAIIEGPSSTEYEAWLETRPDLTARFETDTFKRTTGYEIWRNAWLQCRELAYTSTTSERDAELISRDGMMCEAHPGSEFGHDPNCAGPGMAWIVEGRAAIESLTSAVLKGEDDLAQWSSVENWPLPDVLNKLADATECLLHDYNYDRDGWEQLKYAALAARRHVALLVTTPSPDAAPTFKNTKEAMLYAQRQGIPTVIPVTRRKCSKCGEDLGFNEGDPCGRCVN